MMKVPQKRNQAINPDALVRAGCFETLGVLVHHLLLTMPPSLTTRVSRWLS